VLEHPGVAVVEIGSGGGWLRYQPESGAPPEWVLSALLNQTLPRVMAMRGQSVIHASAVVADGRLLVFAGKSGAGKSTLARGLAESGLELVADDCVELLCATGAGTYNESYVCGNPGHPGWDTQEESSTRQAATGVSVVGVYHLQAVETTPPSGTEFRRLSMLETVMLLNEQMFVLDPTDPRQLRQLFTRAVEIGSKLAAFEMNFPWGKSHLPAVVERITQHAASLQICDSALTEEGK